jgi:Periplasmic binding protein
MNAGTPTPRGSNLRAVRRSHWLVAIALFVLAVMVASCSSAPETDSHSAVLTSSTSTALGTGVTAHTVKIGIAVVNFSCIEQFVNAIRENQDQIYDDYIKYINSHGGIAGRRIVPDFQSYCPITNTQALTLCTQFTEDAHVFAVMGDFIDFSGDAQTCVAKDHHTVLLTFDLTQAEMNQSPPGLIILPGQTPEREDAVLLSLLKSQHTLKGKKIAILSESDNESVVQSSVEPGLKRLGVAMGTTGILDISGSDTSEAQTQLDSFIQRWKSEHVNALFVTGTEVESTQFVQKVRSEMPNVMLINDGNSTDILGFAQQELRAGIHPNPYQGMIMVGGPTPQQYDQSSNWKYCASIYQDETGKVAPNAVSVIAGPNGKTIDTYGSINDACQLLTEFQEIGNRVGRDLNDQNWVKTVNNYGPIRDVGAGQYASLHKGKYDDNDTFDLQKINMSVGSDGALQPFTPLKDVTST